MYDTNEVAIDLYKSIERHSINMMNHRKRNVSLKKPSLAPDKRRRLRGRHLPMQECMKYGELSKDFVINRVALYYLKLY